MTTCYVNKKKEKKKKGAKSCYLHTAPPQEIFDGLVGIDTIKHTI
jgi:hypothetical protein